MVLLTSSAVSVAISSGIICLFTFLLFLSGYILQQQSVRALQLALHPPAQPIPTLPTYFQDLRKEQQLGDGTDNEQEKIEEKTVKKDVEATVISDTPSGSTDQQILAQDPAEQKDDVNTVESTQDTQASPSLRGTESEQQALDAPLSGKDAFVLSTIQPTDLCSAMHFFRAMQQSSSSMIATRKIVFYPSFWKETEGTNAYAEALRLIDEAKRELNLEAQAVTIPLEHQETSTAIARYMQENVLSRREVHELERAIYLPTPGLVLDPAAMVEAFSGSIDDNWDSASAAVSSWPRAMLLSKSSTFIPKRHNLVAEATASFSDEKEGDINSEVLAKEAAYVFFDRNVLLNDESDAWYRRFVERYNKEIDDSCKGIDLQKENTRSELRRRDGREQGRPKAM